MLNQTTRWLNLLKKIMLKLKRYNFNFNFNYNFKFKLKKKPLFIVVFVFLLEFSFYLFCGITEIEIFFKDVLNAITISIKHDMLYNVISFYLPPFLFYYHHYLFLNIIFSFAIITNHAIHLFTILTYS